MTTLPQAEPKLWRCPFNSYYKKGCRCAYCTEVNARNGATTRKNKYLRSVGHELPTDLVPSDDAVRTLRTAIRRHHLTQTEVARAIGSTQQQVNVLVNGRRARIARFTHDAIMKAYGDPSKVPVRHTAPRQRLEYKPYKRKLWSLFAQGWTKPELEKMLLEAGRPAGVVRAGRTRDKHITAENAEQIDWLCEKIGDRHGTSTYSLRNKRMALRADIYPLIHYDDDGRLIRNSITQDQIRERRRVQSKHGDATSRGHGSRS